MKLPKRKSPRLRGFDYSSSGYYFITICTHNKAKILSQIVGAIHELPETRLTEAGKIVDDVINNIPMHLGVKIDKYVVMPNHLHMIMVVEDNRQMFLRKRHIIDNAVGYIKMNATKRIHNEVCEDKVWQRSFHDHIIRNEKDYVRIREYIDNNPISWKTDCFYI